MKILNNLFFYPERGGLDANTYVIKGTPGIIIDPGNPGFLNYRVDAMKKDGLSPGDIGLILNTHLHIDHCSGNVSFKELSGAAIGLHSVQKTNYQLVLVDGTRLLGDEPPEFTEDRLLEGDSITFGGTELEMFICPGHSPDCVCYYWKKEKALFCGDVLFEMNTGRVDLPGGDAQALKLSIESLSQLDLELLLPGHMSPVAGAARIKQNFEFIRHNVFPWL